MSKDKKYFPYTITIKVKETGQEGTLLWRGFDIVIIEVNGIQSCVHPRVIGLKPRQRPTVRGKANPLYKTVHERVY